MTRMVRLFLALALGCSSLSAPAQNAPRPMRILVPFSAGGASDTYTRIAALKITEQTGKSFVVENRTGAGGRIAWEAAAKAAPDVREKLAVQGAEPSNFTPEEFARFLREETGRWTEVIKASGIKVEQ